MMIQPRGRDKLGGDEEGEKETRKFYDNSIVGLKKISRN